MHVAVQGACSKASGSVGSVRREAAGGVGAECSPAASSMQLDRRCSMRTWSAPVDKATETEPDDTENDDVPLSALLHGHASHRLRESFIVVVEERYRYTQ